MYRSALIAVVALLAFCSSPTIRAQPPRVQFPAQPGTAPPLVPVNPNLGAPVYPPPGASLGGSIQPFDPYALPGNYAPPGSVFPGLSPYGPQPTWPGASPVPGAAGQTGPLLSAPPPGAVVTPGLPPLGAPYGQPTTPVPGSSSVWGTSGGNMPPYGGIAADSPATPNAVTGPPYDRLFQDTGITSSYIYGKDKMDLGITDVDISTTAYFANFLNLSNGLRVTPGFVFTWTDGPVAPAIPARLYSAYLDFGLRPQFTPQFSAEVNARFGVYSDFQKVDSNSIRITGTGVGIVKISPESSIKLGVTYIDRVRLKLLPAFGWLWEPNPQKRWDIFFPAPKLSCYLSTYGNRQVWWYVGGEYGGGSWTFEREEQPSKGATDRLDINDIRVFVGLEWWELNRFYGFGELGYVFNREVVYYREPGDTSDLDDSFMVRAGISW